MINRQTNRLVVNVNLVFNYISISFWLNPYISVWENFWFVNKLLKVPLVIIFPIFYNYILTRVDIFNISILIFLYHSEYLLSTRSKFHAFLSNSFCTSSEFVGALTLITLFSIRYFTPDRKSSSDICNQFDHHSALIFNP